MTKRQIRQIQHTIFTLETMLLNEKIIQIRKKSQKHVVFVRVDIPEVNQFPWPVAWENLRLFCDLQNIQISNVYRCAEINSETNKQKRRTVNGWQPYIDYLDADQVKEMMDYTETITETDLNEEFYIPSKDTLEPILPDTNTGDVPNNDTVVSES